MGTMRAIVQDSYGADVWRLAEVAAAEMADGEVLV
jgi:hypothetical protein